LYQAAFFRERHTRIVRRRVGRLDSRSAAAEVDPSRSPRAGHASIAFTYDRLLSATVSMSSQLRPPGRQRQQSYSPLRRLWPDDDDRTRQAVDEVLVAVCQSVSRGPLNLHSFSPRRDNKNLLTGAGCYRDTSPVM